SNAAWRVVCPTRTPGASPTGSGPSAPADPDCGTMDPQSGRLLVVDDEPPVCELLSDALIAHGHQVSCAASAEAALEQLSNGDFDVVLTDLHLDGMDGLGLCTFVTESRPGLPVIVVTGFGNVEAAVGALRAGAWDFVSKPLDLEALTRVVSRALAHSRLEREVRRLRREVAGRESERLHGQSPAMRALLTRLDKAADADASVLITGESGTGKELVARALHERGPRRAGPFVAVDCAAIPASLL